MGSLNINILEVYEIKWMNNGDFISYRHRKIYAGRKENERGVGLLLDKGKRKHPGILATVRQTYWETEREAIQYNHHHSLCTNATKHRRNR